MTNISGSSTGYSEDLENTILAGGGTAGSPEEKLEVETVVQSWGLVGVLSPLRLSTDNSIGALE